MDKRFVARSKRMFAAMRREGILTKRVYLYDKNKLPIGYVSWSVQA